MDTSKYTTWKDIPGFEGKYQVSDDGQVRSIVKGKNGRKPGLISGKIGTRGYRVVSLRLNNNPSYHLVHRLVMAAFVGKCPDGLQVNHIDGNKLNNHISNLEYVTPITNLMHALNVLNKAESQPRGEKHWKAKLTTESVREIRRLYAGGGILQREIAQMFGITNRAISDVICRKIWRHVD
jgi:hypothetical protein